MIKVLKETPITVNDEDYNLQLLHDNTIIPQDACNYCYYRDWDDSDVCYASCCEVHGCNPFTPTFFKLTDL